MDDADRDARWQALLVMRAQFDQDEAGGTAPSVPAPGTGSLGQHKFRRVARFDEALSGWTGWSAVEAPQRRLSA
jgi:hypothetical protein